MITRRAYLLIGCLTLLTACVHQAITQPIGPGGVIASQDAGGVYFTAQGHLLWLKEGVPPEMFTLTEKGWYMSDLQWHQGNSIRLKEKNRDRPGRAGAPCDEPGRKDDAAVNDAKTWEPEPKRSSWLNWHWRCALFGHDWLHVYKTVECLGRIWQECASTCKRCGKVEAK